MRFGDYTKLYSPCPEKSLRYSRHIIDKFKYISIICDTSRPEDPLY